MLLLNTDSINAIEENDLTKISSVLFESLSIKRVYKKESVVEYKKDMVDGLIDLLKKMLFHGANIPQESKLNIVNLLDKLKTQKEYLDTMKSNISNSDTEKASERLSKKVQSAFELK
jgi:hypothetical protein